MQNPQSLSEKPDIRPLRWTMKLAAVLLVAGLQYLPGSLLAAGGGSVEWGSVHNRPPIADAGSLRYAAIAPVTLDGTGSLDLDGDQPLTYRWSQVDGPGLTVTGEDTASPSISGFVQSTWEQRAVFELVVSDAQTSSAPDRVEVVIVPIFGEDTLDLYNPPFRPDMPTIIAFGGGDCISGVSLILGQEWLDLVNLITGPYTVPYKSHGDAFIAYLSGQAPDYRQPIQTIGWSTGGSAAIVVANYLNQTYNDPRFAVNRVTLLDSYCTGFDTPVERFNANPVAGEQAWVDAYRIRPEPVAGALNIYFSWGAHSTPPSWWAQSISPERWPDGDMYNGGLTGAYFLSVAGPGKNLQLATDRLSYYFECTDDSVDCLRQVDRDSYPGLIPQPVTLIGPEDGAVVGADGALLTCEESAQAVSYQLLFGPAPHLVDEVVSETSEPPLDVISSFPYAPTYWTIRVRDTWGSTIHADPIALTPTSTTGAVRRGAGPRVSPS